MSKTELVKIGVSPQLAEGIRRARTFRQILDQHDAAVARLGAAMEERIRELVKQGEATPEVELPLADQPVAAAS